MTVAVFLATTAIAAVTIVFVALSALATLTISFNQFSLFAVFAVIRGVSLPLAHRKMEETNRN